MYNLTGIYQSMRNEGLFFGIGGILIIIASLPLKKKKKKEDTCTDINQPFLVICKFRNSILGEQNIKNTYETRKPCTSRI